MKEEEIKNMRKHYILLSIILVLIVWSIYSYFSGGIVNSFIKSDTSSLINYLDGFKPIAGIIFVVLIILEVVLAPIPAFTLYITGGLIFGTFLGGTLSLIGNVIGAGIAFWIARKFAKKYVRKKISKNKIKKFDKFFDKHGALSIFLLRINPLTSSDVFSYVAGLTSMKFRSLIIGTLLGLAPLIFIQSYLGSDFLSQTPIISLILIITTIIYLILFIYLIWALRDNKK